MYFFFVLVVGDGGGGVWKELNYYEERIKIICSKNPRKKYYYN